MYSHISLRITIRTSLIKFSKFIPNNLIIKIRCAYRISANSFRGKYSFLKVEIQRSQYIRPKVTVHKCAETIQGRKLFAEIRYSNNCPQNIILTIRLYINICKAKFYLSTNKCYICFSKTPVCSRSP